MSALPENSSTAVDESFADFSEKWLVQKNQYRQDLISELQHWKDNSPPGADARSLYPLINRVLEHYKEYYRNKAMWAKVSVFPIVAPPWRSTYENIMLWIGGWSPTMAIRLLYSEAELQTDGRLDEWRKGITRGDLADLSIPQMKHMEELERKTIDEQERISKQMAKFGDSGADRPTVELAHAAMASDGVDEERIEQVLRPKEARLQELLNAADDLRMETLKSVMGILSPSQSAHYLIAAAELDLGWRKCGQKKDQKIIHNNKTKAD